jgi:hypothetical protein
MEISDQFHAPAALPLVNHLWKAFELHEQYYNKIQRELFNGTVEAQDAMTE